jgi:methionyl-tRNA formyltransferase
VINGETETGVTTFKLQQDIDTGNILLQDRLPIGPAETAGDVHDHMKEIGARLLVRTIEGLAAGTLKEVPQIQPIREPGLSGPSVIDPSTLKHAPKIFTETCRIDWTKSTTEIYNLIRGLSPFPAAFTYLDGKLLKIYHSIPFIEPHPALPPGHVDTDQKSYLRFSTADGYIRATEVQMEGKKKMKIEDFLRGYKPRAREI